MTCCGGTAAVLSVLGFVAVLVGVATPGWFQMSMDLSSMESSDSSFGSNTLMEQMGSIDISMSVFYIKVCVGKLACLTGDMETIAEQGRKHGSSSGFNPEMLQNGFSSLEQLQAEGAGAILLSFIGMVLSLVSVCSARKNNKCPIIAACILLGLAGINISILIGQFANANSEINQAFTLLSGTGLSTSMHTSFPYSLLIAGIGAICLFVAAIAAAVTACTMKNEQGGQVLTAVQVGGGVHLANIVPGVQGVSQGYTVLQEPVLIQNY